MFTFDWCTGGQQIGVYKLYHENVNLRCGRRNGTLQLDGGHLYPKILSNKIDNSVIEGKNSEVMGIEHTRNFNNRDLMKF